VNEEWAEKLMALPFKSCKYLFSYSHIIVRKGRTVHLLKAGSKKINNGRKRRKISVIGTP